MSPTDQIQDLFDRAFSSVPAGVERSPLALHQRLTRRRLRNRISTLGGALAIAVSATALFTGLASNSAFAVTLYSGTTGSVTTVQLSADQHVMSARLRAVGFPSAVVKVGHGTLVVTNGPKDLANPSSYLTASPELLIRSVTCYAGAQSGPPSTKPLPATCSGPQYVAPTATPDGISSSTGFSEPNIRPDPALSAYATTTPAQDAASPNAYALLPILNSSSSSVTQRFLVGPTLLTLSSKVASATVVPAPVPGGWMINVRLNPSESRLWDQVAAEYFHRQLAIDLNGVIDEAPLIQPDSTSFNSFDGQMQLLAVTKSGAYDLAAALTSGPLAIPLAVNAHAGITHPACQSSQIRVTAGATATDATYTVRTSTGVHQVSAYEIVPVSFYNKGATCHLLMGAPIFQAVRNTTALSATTPPHDLSIPAGAGNTKRMVVPRHQKIEALFVVVKPVGSSFAGCEPATTSGFSVGDFGNPIDTTHFIRRQLREVCFDSGAGAHVLNIGASWEPVH